MPTIDEALVGALDPTSPAAEAYRTLRTGVQFAGIDRPVRTLLVTSAAPEDDRAVVAANLALAFAQGGSKTVLVDCNLRRPRQHALFGVANGQGLTTYLAGEARGEWPLVDTGIANLRLLPAGPSLTNPVDLLGSQRFQEALAQLAAQADMVVLDAPPVLAVADAAVLARRADGVLLVIRAGRTKRDQAAKARAVLAKVNANVLGAVLTNAKVDPSLQKY
ncbi:MAG: CpsD/CapB family tyrosine-protein kinase [Chloroflexota bacterium]